MKILFTVGCVLTIFFCANGQFNFGASNANSAALGNALSTHQMVFAAIDNQAGLAGLNDFSVGLTTKNSFLIEGLYSLSAAVGLPTKSGTFGAGLQYKGFEGYTELKANIAYGRKLLDNLSIGAAINIYQLSINNYGSTTVVNGQIGLQAKLSQQLLLGVNLNNPIKISLSEDGQNILPTVIVAGLRYQPSKKTAVYVEGEKNLSDAAIFKGGLSYEIAANFALMIGATSGVDAFTAGLSWQVNSFQISFAGNYHTVLGFSPTLSLSFNKVRKDLD